MSAGARGVTRVRTARGETTVDPDPAGVQRLAAVRIGAAELDAFARAVRVGAHAEPRQGGTR